MKGSRVQEDSGFRVVGFGGFRRLVFRTSFFFFGGGGGGGGGP